MKDILQPLAEIGISGNSDSTATSSSALSKLETSRSDTQRALNE
jgi:hypothetical protein